MLVQLQDAIEARLAAEAAAAANLDELKGCMVQVKDANQKRFVVEDELAKVTVRSPQPPRYFYAGFFVRVCYRVMICTISGLYDQAENPRFEASDWDSGISRADAAQ